MRFLQGVSRLLAAVEDAVAQLSALAMVAIMLIVVADVVLRYAFASPLFFAYDLISMYLVVLLFFLSISRTLHHHGHVAIDLFQPFLPMRLRHAGEALCYAAGTVVMALIAWRLSERTHVAFLEDQVTATTIPWPIWLSVLPAAFGCWLFTLRCLYRTVAHAASAVTGRRMVEVPPPPITDMPATVSAGADMPGAAR